MSAIIASLQVKTEISIPLSRISDLLCNAFEGGSNYWYEILEFIKPTSVEFITDGKPGESEIAYRHLDYPLNAGGALMIGDREDEETIPKRLDLSAIGKGLELLANKHPKHFADFMSENDDADTGDVFLQLCLFGEVIYG